MIVQWSICSCMFINYREMTCYYKNLKLIICRPINQKYLKAFTIFRSMNAHTLWVSKSAFTAFEVKSFLNKAGKFIPKTKYSVFTLLNNRQFHHRRFIPIQFHVRKLWKQACHYKISKLFGSVYNFKIGKCSFAT